MNRHRRLPFSLLAPLLPDAEREEVLDDLATERTERAERSGNLRAELWLWRQTLGSIPASLGRSVWRGRTGFEPAASRFRPGGTLLESTIVDLRGGARHLRAHPWYAGAVVLTLALGVGGTAAAASLVRTFWAEALPFDAEEELVEFWSPYDWSQAEHSMLRPEYPGFASVAAHREEPMTLRRADGLALPVEGVAASAELFTTLGRGAGIGRVFEVGDDLAGAAPVVVLSHSLWEDLGADAALVGRDLILDGVARQVVGIMPPDFWFPRPGIGAWVSETFDPGDRSGNYALVGRVEPGRDPTAMAEPLAEIARILGEAISYPPEWDKTRDPSVKPLREVLVGDARPALLATAGALLAILLVAAANVATLMLGRLTGRSRELAVRSALGAPRTRLARQLLVESTLLGVGVGTVAGGVSIGVFRVLRATLPLGPLAETAQPDPRVALGAAALGFFAMILTSLPPAVELLRRDSGTDTLRASRGTTGPGRGSSESILVVSQVALAVVLAVGAALLARSVARLDAIDPGLRSEELAVLEIAMPENGTSAARLRDLHRLRRELARLPGIDAVAAVQHLPVRAPGWSTWFDIEGNPLPDQATTYIRMVTPGYFETVGLQLRQGRTFDEADAGSGEARAVVNEALARKFFPDEDPVGRRIALGFGDGWARVIGVVENEAVARLTDAPAPARYVLYDHLPFTSDQHALFLSTGSTSRAAGILREARSLVERETPSIAVVRATTMSSVVREGMGARPGILRLLALLALFAVGLGGVGIYGVVAHYVGRRSREWSLRLALGQRPNAVTLHVLRHGARPLGVGLAVGLIASGGLGRLLEGLLYGVTPADPIGLAAGALLLLVTGLLAALVPAFRAGRRDPAALLQR